MIHGTPEEFCIAVCSVGIFTRTQLKLSWGLNSTYIIQSWNRHIADHFHHPIDGGHSFFSPLAKPIRLQEPRHESAQVEVQRNGCRYEKEQAYDLTEIQHCHSTSLVTSLCLVLTKKVNKWLNVVKKFWVAKARKNDCIAWPCSRKGQISHSSTVMLSSPNNAETMCSFWTPFITCWRQGMYLDKSSQKIS